MRKTLGAIALLLLLAMGVVVNALRPSPSATARDAIGEEFSYFKVGSMRAYRSGTGPLIMLLPSLGREASDFNELGLKLNAMGYETLSIDPRGINGGRLYDGIGFDQMSFDLGIIHRAYSDNEPAIIIGHAYGNRLARNYSFGSTKNINGVVLLAAGGQVPMPPKAEQSLKNIFNPLRTYRSRMKDVRYAFFADGNEIPDYWKRGWHRKTAMAQAKSVANSANDNSWHCAGGVPMLIVQPMQDRIAPIENAYALKQKCPQEVKIVEVQNAGHALLPEQPEAVAEAVLDFLAKHHPTDKNTQ